LPRRVTTLGPCNASRFFYRNRQHPTRDRVRTSMQLKRGFASLAVAALNGRMRLFSNRNPLTWAACTGSTFA
jgi:hypothetical protein